MDPKLDKDGKPIQETVTPGNPANEQDTTVSEEELEWASLKGSTQDRVRQVIKERNDFKNKFSEMENKLKEMEAKLKPDPKLPAAPANEGELTPEQQKAIQTLRKFGIVTKEDLQVLKDQQIIEDTYTRLEGKYDGADGKPAFNRKAIEKHMQDTGIYNPEKAYEDLYREELFDLRMKERGSGSPSYTPKPSGRSARGGEPLTAESLAERMRRPDGRQWWEKNRNKILPVIGDLMK